MEYVVLAGLGWLGYYLNAHGKKSRYDHAPIRSGKNDFISSEDRPILKEDMSLYHKRYAQSLDPEATGIIPPGYKSAGLYNQSGSATYADGKPMLPHFSSERKQHTSTYYKQSRMELFTGAIYQGKSQSGTYKNKEERAPLFEPQESRARVTSAGTVGNPQSNNDAADRYVTGNKFHHMHPTEKILVGPGLNLPPDVPAAGGYQQFFRILPTNAGAYRKNNLPGGVIPGKAPVAAVPKEAAPMIKKGPEREWKTPLYTGTRATFTEEMARPDVGPALKPTRKGQAGYAPYFGIADGDQHGIYVPQGRPTYLKSDCTDRGMVAVSNVTGGASAAGVGAYLAKDVQIRPTDREMEPDGQTGVRGPNKPYAAGRVERPGPTNRSVTGAFLQTHPTKKVPEHKVANVAPHKPTNRQTTHGYYVGGANAHTDAPANQYYVVKNVDAAKARRDATLHGHTPGPMRINRRDNDPGEVITNKTMAGSRAANLSSRDTSARVLPAYEKRNALPSRNPLVTA